MHSAALRVELRLRDARSLKEKRNTLRTLMQALTKKFPVAVSEVDHQDLWQRSSIGIATVAPQAGQLDRILHAVERSLRDHKEVEVLGVQVSYMEERP